MRRNNAEHIGDVIRLFLRQQGLESPLNEYRLVQAWKDVVGPAMARYTSNLYIKNQTLYVHLTSAVLRQELMMARELLVKNLNQQVGAQVIVNIVFRKASEPFPFFGPYFIHASVERLCRYFFSCLKLVTNTYVVGLEKGQELVVVSFPAS